MPRHWLMKSEPSVYSVEDLARDGRTSWEGVRNYQARNLMREMQTGDLALFYHSSADPPGVAGVARIVREAYPDPSAWDPGSPYHDPTSSPGDPRWWMVDVAHEETFARLVPLSALKTQPGLEEMMVTRQGRLSVQPVSPAEYEIVLRLGRAG